MKKIIVFTVILFVALKTYCQTYLTRNGNVSFYSSTPLEEIKSQNNEVVSVLNAATGDIEFRIAIKSFHFPKIEMEEHFNDKDYMASDKFPKAAFKGSITNISSINFSKDGVYNVTVNGNLTIKDVTKPVTAQGTISIKNGTVTAVSTFKILRKDYHVVGESFVQNKIGEEIQITANCQYDKQ